MKSFLIAASVGTALLLVSATNHAQQPSPDRSGTNGHTGALMQRKLDHAKTILEGLALEDYDKIAGSARRLRLLSLEAGWSIVQTDNYRHQSADFRRACDQIEKAAKAKDASRAALSYVALTVRCVECHNYMRENKITLTNAQPEGSVK